MAPITDKDLYVKRFSELKRGAPLYQPCEVQVGDVGYIDPHDGFFQKLYNIANPPRNGRRGCPPPFKFETVGHVQELDAIHMKNSKGSGGSLQATIPKGQMEFVFSEVKRRECILIPGSVVVLECIKKTGRLPKYMTDHLSWIGRTFIGDEGYQFPQSSLILVHRTVKTDRWAIAVNTSSEVVKDLSFKVASTVGATLWGQWSASSLVSRRGPVPDDGASHPTGVEGANQTIFVRRIALRLPVIFFRQPKFGATPVAHMPLTIEQSTLMRFLQRVCGTITCKAHEEPNWWVVEKPRNTQSLPTATSGVSESAYIEEEGDPDEE